ncbi:MAG: TonB family protein [Bacteroidales bacterium]|nr:TonB family protein [Bacteroidales bacterium]
MLKINKILFLILLVLGPLFVLNAQEGKWSAKGDAAYQKGNYSKAISLYKKGVKAEEGASCYGLGLCYLEGHGTSQDLNEAAFYLYRGAELSNLKASAEMLVRLADKGNADAQMLAGHCYQVGYGLDQDLSKAIQYYQMSRKYNLKYLVDALRLSIEEEGDKDQKSSSPGPDTSGGEIFRFATQAPEFPGGVQALVNMLAQNAVYPEYCRAREIKGTVLIEFVVEADGQVSHVKVKLSCFPLLDNEALRVVSKQPRWEPGILDGKPVRCYYAVPMRFAM